MRSLTKWSERSACDPACAPAVALFQWRHRTALLAGGVEHRTCLALCLLTCEDGAGGTLRCVAEVVKAEAHRRMHATQPAAPPPPPPCDRYAPYNRSCRAVQCVRRARSGPPLRLRCRAEQHVPAQVVGSTELRRDTSGEGRLAPMHHGCCLQPCRQALPGMILPSPSVHA